MFDEAKEDAQFRKDLATAMRESNASFNASINNIGNSIMQLSQSMSKSMEMFTQAMLQQGNMNRPPYNQNLFYQNVSPSASQHFSQYQHQQQQPMQSGVSSGLGNPQSYNQWLNNSEHPNEPN